MSVEIPGLITLQIDRWWPSRVAVGTDWVVLGTVASRSGSDQTFRGRRGNRAPQRSVQEQ